jgi:hypothetical protein
MRNKTKRLLLALPLVAVGAISACGGDDGGSASESGGEGVLSEACPATLVVQTDWFPESEHGALYQMLGEDYSVDVAKKIVSGTLIDSSGNDTGVTLEVRTGGPAIGFQPVSATMAADESITMGYAATDDQAFSYDDIPLLSVVAPLEINPQIIMWDPETYPDVETIADLGEQGITMNVFAGGTYLEVFKAEGVVSEDQIDPSYDGGPSRFISEGGKIAQQGFASAEPWQYKNEFTEWGKDVKYLGDSSVRQGSALGLPEAVRADRSAGGHRLRERPGSCQRDHHRRRRAVRRLLGVRRGCGGLFGRDAEGARPGGQRTERHAR